MTIDHEGCLRGGRPLLSAEMHSDAEIQARTDSYFNRTREIVERFGDKRVTYAFFVRRPVVAACDILVRWFEKAARARGVELECHAPFKEGEWVGAGEPLLYVTGPFTQLVELETLALQKLGPPSVAAHNAYQMCMALPHVKFLAMEARHCAGYEMQELLEYGAAVGSRAAQRDGAVGFIGCACDALSPMFGTAAGFGTMPHALVGYAGSTLRSVEMFHEVYPDRDVTILPDYYGREVTDTIQVCRRFSQLADEGRINVRLDTHGGRFLEGMDLQSSYAILERYVPGTIKRYRSDRELRDLVGMGVSAAAIWRMREALDEAGFPRVGILVSSGFDVAKCLTMAEARAPIDAVGTGSFIPEKWSETYTTADVIRYDDDWRVKKGREFLIPGKRGAGQPRGPHV